MKKMMKDMKFQEFGRRAKYFDIGSIKNINRDLSVMSGFSTSVQIFNKIPYVKIDYKTRIVRNQKAIDYIGRLYNISHDYN